MISGSSLVLQLKVVSNRYVDFMSSDPIVLLRIEDPSCVLHSHCQDDRYEKDCCARVTPNFGLDKSKYIKSYKCTPLGIHFLMLAWGLWGRGYT